MIVTLRALQAGEHAGGHLWLGGGARGVARGAALARLAQQLLVVLRLLRQVVEPAPSTPLQTITPQYTPMYICHGKFTLKYRFFLYI